MHFSSGDMSKDMIEQTIRNKKHEINELEHGILRLEENLSTINKPRTIEERLH